MLHQDLLMHHDLNEQEHHQQFHSLHMISQKRSTITWAKGGVEAGHLRIARDIVVIAYFVTTNSGRHPRPIPSLFLSVYWLE